MQCASCSTTAPMPNAKEDARGTNALMQAADQGHADVLTGARRAWRRRRGHVRCRSCATARTAALGKSDDPRAAVRRQVIAILCDQPTPDLGRLQELAAGDRTEDEVLGGGCRGRRRCRRRPVQHCSATRLGFVIRRRRQARTRRATARRRRADGARVCGARGQRRRRARAARRRRRRQSSDALRLEPAARRDAEPQLSVWEIPHRARRRRQSRQQGRLDAALSRDGQPQPRGRRLPDAHARLGRSRVHQAAARRGRRSECAARREHGDAHRLHESVARRRGRDRVPARFAVRRRRADEAAARARRGSEDQHEARRDAARRGRRHRLGRGRHERALACRDGRGRQAVARARDRSELPGRHGPRRLCTARRTRARPRS